MPLLLQDPSGESFANLLDRTAADADEGGAIFAYATKTGVERFFSLPNIVRLLGDQHHFMLVVGTDAITNAEALLCIQGFVDRYSGLQAWAFVHDLNVTFHPKYCWFTKGADLHLIVGSGNLTSRGLGVEAGLTESAGNWEAFAVGRRRGHAREDTGHVIGSWIEGNRAAGRLLPLADPRVRDRAIANSYVRPVNPRVQQRAAGRLLAMHPGFELARQVAAVEQSGVMIRELPLNRSGQADVTREGLEFFGFRDQPKRVLIQHVTLDNQLHEPAERWIFVQSSQNYRIEISELARLPYTRAPNDGRTVLVAVKLDDSAFRYAIVPTDSEHYPAIDRLLGEIPAGRRLMRTVFTDTDRLKADWPEAPASLFPMAAISAEDLD